MRSVERAHARLPRASAAVGDALNAGYGYQGQMPQLQHASNGGALDTDGRPKMTPEHELERMRRKDCSALRRCAFKRSQLIALRPNKSKRVPLTRRLRRCGQASATNAPLGIPLPLR
jgi:hypothetical protein